MVNSVKSPLLILLAKSNEGWRCGFLKTALIDVERLIAKKLHIDTDKNSNQDFEAWFDGTNGLKINNNGEEIFKVDRNGNVFMKNATLRDGIFTGEIYSGPLELINRTPESKIYSFKSNTRIDSYFNEYGEILAWGKGIYKGETFEKLRLTYTEGGNMKQWSITFSNQKGFSSLCRLYQLYWDRREEKWEVRTDSKLDEDIVFYTNKNTKTLKLKDLPKSEPTEKNTLWIENGFLKIKQ